MSLKSSTKIEKAMNENPLKTLTYRAGIYARYSSDMQSETSADEQIERIQYKLKNAQVRSNLNDRRPIELSPDWILKDEAQSGRLAGRENYEKVLEGIRQKSFDILIVDDLSRLTRSLGNLLGLYDMLKWYEVELISICDGISSEDPSAKTFFTVKGMVNDFSNDIHAERVIRGMEIRALNGFSCGDYPYGYDSAATKLENAKGRPFPSHFKITVNEVEAHVVRRIFDMYDLNIGTSRIAKALNAEKVPSPGAATARPGKLPLWSPRSIQNILQNEKYVGVWRWKKTKLGVHPETRLRSAKDRPATDWVSHLAGKETREDLRIVSQDTWDRIAAKLVENKKVSLSLAGKSRWGNKSANLPDHPFSGLMECAVCSSNFMLISGRRGGYYGCMSAHKMGVCSNKQLLHISSIESTLTNVVIDNLRNPEILKYASEQYNKVIRQKLSTAPQRLKQIDGELTLVGGELDNLLQFIISGNASDTVNSAIKDREQRKLRLMSEVRTLQKTQNKIVSVSEDDIKDRLENLANLIKQQPVQTHPAIRALFPKRISMSPKGKSMKGHSLYSMQGEIVLNGALARSFEKNAQKEKGEVASALPRRFNPAQTRPCDSKRPGFSVFEIGVTNGA